jgi:hypothetical protein
MPILCDPKQQYPIVLESDKAKDRPPTFFAYALSGRQQMANTERIKQFRSDAEAFEFLPELIVSWKDLNDADGNTIPFDASRLADILTNVEAWELIRTIQQNEHLTIDEKKS